MTRIIKDLFRGAMEASSLTVLQSKILAEIAELEIRKNKRRLIWGGVFSVASLTAFLPMAYFTIVEFSQSGLGSYLSLLVSDSSVVMANFGDYVLSVVEATPFMAITVTLLSVYLLLISVRYFLSNLKSESEFSFRLKF
ncbi:MAG: hypothetical protein WCO10_02430 [bacterium]